MPTYTRAMTRKAWFGMRYLEKLNLKLSMLRFAHKKNCSKQGRQRRLAVIWPSLQTKRVFGSLQRIQNTSFTSCLESIIWSNLTLEHSLKSNDTFHWKRSSPHHIISLRIFDAENLPTRDILNHNFFHTTIGFEWPLYPEATANQYGI